MQVAALGACPRACLACGRRLASKGYSQVRGSARCSATCRCGSGACWPARVRARRRASPCSTSARAPRWPRAGLCHGPVCRARAVWQGGGAAVRAAAGQWDPARQHGAEQDASGRHGDRAGEHRRDREIANTSGDRRSGRGRTGRRLFAQSAPGRRAPLRGDCGQDDPMPRVPSTALPSRARARPSRPRHSGKRSPQPAWVRTRPRPCCATAMQACGGCSTKCCPMPRLCWIGGTPPWASSTGCKRPVASVGMSLTRACPARRSGTWSARGGPCGKGDGRGAGAGLPLFVAGRSAASCARWPALTNYASAPPTQVAAAAGQASAGELEAGVGAQMVEVGGVLVAAGDGEHAGA